uniref:Eukaryotic translation initiation factor 2-alpha kinase 2 n=1 Tax=Sparus aurata TaxID=8175 RepID=A0A671VK55_SPAAU
MGKNKNYVAELQKYAKSTRSVLKFEDVKVEGSDSTKRFYKKAVIDGQDFPMAVGKNGKEAKQNAAKCALRSLGEKENPRPHVLLFFSTEHAAKTSSQVNHERLLNECRQKNKVPLRAVKWPRLAPNYATCCSFVGGEEEYLAVSGKIRREPDEEAAKLVCQDTSGSRPTEVSHNTHKFLNEKTSVQSKTIRSTSDFDSLESLGKGAFGDVYKAREKYTGKSFALKIVPCKEWEKAPREVMALSDLLHRNIVRYFACWVDDIGYQGGGSETDSYSSTQSSSDNLSRKYLYIQMELCKAVTLREWIGDKNTQRDFKRKESLTIAQQIASGVEYIHSKNLVHRDLKPANIMFGQDGEVKIGDFGLVTADNDYDAGNLMERTLYKGTPSYMAPEQSRKTYDRKVDIFACGLIFFELLWKFSTGHEKQAVSCSVPVQKLYLVCIYQSFIIKPMLCLKPEDRPEAKALKKDLEECICRLNAHEIDGHSSRSV